MLSRRTFIASAGSAVAAAALPMTGGVTRRVGKSCLLAAGYGGDVLLTLVAWEEGGVLRIEKLE